MSVAICQRCGSDMSTADNCVATPIKYPDGTTRERIPFGSPQGRAGLDGEEIPEKCGDCGVSLTGFHHLYCDMEICPRCGGQLISCDCLG
jgi:hypothetical protein